MDDREIRQWDKRLDDQAKRGWENYKHLHIDLSTARLDEPVRITGEYLYVEESSGASAVAKIKLNRNTNDALDLEKGVKIETVFIEVFITNDALEDEWLDLVFGINFKYKKKITVEEIPGALNFLIGGPIITPAGVDLTITPGGVLYINTQTIINSYLQANSVYIPTAYIFFKRGGGLSAIELRDISEIVTIPVGQGAGGIVTTANLAPNNSTIISCVCRVTQAPGGGATTIDIGRTGAGNLDEFIDGIATALGTTGTFAANHDVATIGPVLNAANDTLTITTDANVLVSDMKVRIVVFYRQEVPPSS